MGPFRGLVGGKFGGVLGLPLGDFTTGLLEAYL